MGPPEQTIDFQAVGALTDTVNVGDTLPPPAARLLVKGADASSAIKAQVISGTDVIQLDSAGRLIVLKPGQASVKVTPNNAAVTDTSLHLLFELLAVVPRVVIAGPDTAYSIGEELQFTATATTSDGVTVSGVTPTWSVDGLDTAATLLTNPVGRIRAVKNGDITIRASVDTATVTKVVRVRQRVATIGVTPAGVALTSGTTTPTATARDANGNVIAGTAFAWASLNPAVATISATTGVVTAVASGQATISATAGTVTSYGLVTVAMSAAQPVNLWLAQSSSTASFLNGVWSAGPNLAFAVGTLGAISRFDGTNWTSQPSNTSSDLRDVWGTSGSNVFAVGISAPQIAAFNGTSWSVSTLGTEAFSAVWGSSPNRVFAAGSNILLNTGSTWQTSFNPAGKTIIGLWGSSASDVWAVGGDNDNTPSVFHYDGAGWTSVSVAGEVINGIWGASASNIFAVGRGGRVLRFDGTQWTSSVPAGTDTRELTSVWGTGPSDVYAVGALGKILRFDGNAWSTMSDGNLPSSGPNYQGVHGFGPHVFVVGPASTILRGYRGASIAVAPSNPTIVGAGTTQQLSATVRDQFNSTLPGATLTWSSDDNNIVTVNPSSGLVTAVATGTANICVSAPGGVQGCTLVTVAQAAAASVSVTPAGASILGGTFNFTAIARDANSNTIPGKPFTWASLNPSVATIDGSGVATAVGSGQSTIAATADGITAYALLTVAMPSTAVNLWAPVPSGTTTQFNGIGGINATNIYAVGDNALMRQFTGTGWNQVTLPTTRTLNAVWASSASDVFAVGNIGTIVHFNGTDWATMANPAPAGISGVWGSSPRDVFAVGPNGMILHYDGSQWTSMTSNTVNSLTDVHGFSASDVFASGNDGTVQHYDGNTWSSAANGLPTNASLAGIWGTSGSDLYGVDASGGRFFHYNGSAWSELLGATGTGVPLAVWGASSSDVYFAGVLGRINRHDGSSFSLHAGATSSQLQGLWGTSAGQVWAVGFDGTILSGYRGASVTVTPANPALTVLDDTLTLSATARDASNNVISGVIFSNWSSDNLAVATVDPATGLVTAEGNGSANICRGVTAGTASGCTTVTVTGFSPEEIELLVQEASRLWFLTSTALRTAGATSTQARSYTSSFNNGDMFFYSSIDNPSSSAELWNRNTRSWQNDPAAAQRFNVSAAWEGANLLSEPIGYYRVLRYAVDVLKIIRVKGVTVRNASDTKRAETMAALMQGAALAGIALNYDKGFVIDENTASHDPITFAPLAYSNRLQMRDAALAKFDEAVALALSESFTTLAAWTNGNSYTSTQVVAIARTLAASTHVNYARDATEAATVNWAQVATLTAQGISGTASLAYVGNGSTWISEVHQWFNDIDVGRVSTRIARLLHPATQADPWPVSGNPQPSSIDPRLADGSFGNASNAASLGTVVRTPGGGSQFAWSATAIFPPARGDYHQSNIAHVRYDPSGIQAPGGIVDGVGPMPMLTASLNDLLRAEASLRTGNTAQAQASINTVRARNSMPPLGAMATGSPSDGPCTSVGTLSTNGAACTLWSHLIYEKEIELLGLGMQPFFEERRLPVVTVIGRFVQGLIPGTPREMPVPWFVLQGRGEGLYTWGGTGPANSTPP